MGDNIQVETTEESNLLNYLNKENNKNSNIEENSHIIEKISELDNLKNSFIKQTDVLVNEAKKDENETQENAKGEYEKSKKKGTTLTKIKDETNVSTDETEKNEKDDLKKADGTEKDSKKNTCSKDFGEENKLKTGYHLNEPKENQQLPYSIYSEQLKRENENIETGEGIQRFQSKLNPVAPEYKPKNPLYIYKKIQQQTKKNLIALIKSFGYKGIKLEKISGEYCKKYNALLNLNQAGFTNIYDLLKSLDYCLIYEVAKDEVKEKDKETDKKTDKENEDNNSKDKEDEKKKDKEKEKEKENENENKKDDIKDDIKDQTEKDNKLSVEKEKTHKTLGNLINSVSEKNLLIKYKTPKLDENKQFFVKIILGTLAECTNYDPKLKEEETPVKNNISLTKLPQEVKSLFGSFFNLKALQIRCEIDKLQVFLEEIQEVQIITFLNDIKVRITPETYAHKIPNMKYIKSILPNNELKLKSPSKLISKKYSSNGVSNLTSTNNAAENYNTLNSFKNASENTQPIKQIGSNEQLHTNMSFSNNVGMSKYGPHKNIQNMLSVGSNSMSLNFDTDRNLLNKLNGGSTPFTKSNTYTNEFMNLLNINKFNSIKDDINKKNAPKILSKLKLHILLFQLIVLLTDRQQMEWKEINKVKDYILYCSPKQEEPPHAFANDLKEASLEKEEVAKKDGENEDQVDKKKEQEKEENGCNQKQQQEQKQEKQQEQKTQQKECLEKENEKENEKEKEKEAETEKGTETEKEKETKQESTQETEQSQEKKMTVLNYINTSNSIESVDYLEEHYGSCDSSSPLKLDNILSNRYSKNYDDLIQSYEKGNDENFIGVFVSTIKSEWNRLYTEQYPLSFYLNYYKTKKLRKLLEEIPNLIISGYGRNMQVFTLDSVQEHFDNLSSDKQKNLKTFTRSKFTTLSNSHFFKVATYKQVSASYMEGDVLNLMKIIERDELKNPKVDTRKFYDKPMLYKSVTNSNFRQDINYQTLNKNFRRFDEYDKNRTNVFQNESLEVLRSHLHKLLYNLVIHVCKKQNTLFLEYKSKGIILSEYEMNKQLCEPIFYANDLTYEDFLTPKKSYFEKVQINKYVAQMSLYGIYGIKFISLRNEWFKLYKCDLRPLMKLCNYNKIGQMISNIPNVYVFGEGFEAKYLPNTRVKTENTAFKDLVSTVLKRPMTTEYNYFNRSYYPRSNPIATSGPSTSGKSNTSAYETMMKVLFPNLAPKGNSYLQKSTNYYPTFRDHNEFKKYNTAGYQESFQHTPFKQNVNISHLLKNL